jgi:hypothetical protein
MAEISTTVDNELCKSGFTEDLRDNFYEVPFPCCSEVKHEGTSCDE